MKRKAKTTAKSTKSKSRLSRPKTLRDALDIIQDLLTGRKFSHDLWNVLTGLRGPDSRNAYAKAATTCVIRKVAFPKEPTKGLSMFHEDTVVRASYRKTSSALIESPHFTEHACDAFASLGLVWDEVNPPNPPTKP
jgi:hypothetical protein